MWKERVMPQERTPTRRALPHLKAWRVYRLLSQAKLAETAGVGEMTIVRLERRGEANEITIYKLAKALGITVQQILEEGPPEQTTIDIAA
jgi:DNA-binding XRE family transcriptional regulator